MKEPRDQIASCQADDIDRTGSRVVWRTRHPSLMSVPGRNGPFSTTRPALSATTIIGQASMPSLIWAASKKTGEVMWSHRFRHVTELVQAHDRVYAYVEERIVCLDASNGDMFWETPWWRSTGGGIDGGQRIVRRPTVAEERIVWPGAGGVVTCADAHSGALKWTVKRRGTATSPLVIKENKVIGIETPGLLFGLDISDGRPIWQCAVPGNPMYRGLAVGLGGVLVRLDDAILLLRAEDGAIETRWSWPGKLTGHIAVGTAMAFAIRSEPEDNIFNGRHGVIPNDSHILRLHRDGSVLWDLPSSVRRPRIAWDEQSGFLFEACDGVGVIDPTTGRRKHLIAIPDAAFYESPVIDGDHIYVVSFDGELVCLRSPVADDDRAS
jgi:outer membrane protein assembly factor BamB